MGSNHRLPLLLLQLFVDCGDFPTDSGAAQPTKTATSATVQQRKHEHLHHLDMLLFVFVFPVDNGGQAFGSPLTLDDLFDRNFQVHDPGAKWINGKEKYTLNASQKKDFRDAAVPDNNNNNNNNHMT